MYGNCHNAVHRNDLERILINETTTSLAKDQYVLPHNGPPSPQIQPPKIFGLIVLSILVLIMILGNLLSLVTILWKRTLRQSPSYNYVLSLAVVDFCIAAIIMPLYIVWEYHGVWPYGEQSCRIVTALDIAFSDISIYSILLIAIDKYILITRPLKYPSFMTLSVSRILVVVIWVTFMTLGFATIYTDLALDSEAESFRNNCVFVMNDIYTYVTSATVFLLPFTFLIFSSLRIYFTARRHLIQIAQQNQCSLPTNSQSVETITGPSCTGNSINLPLQSPSFTNNNTQQLQRTYSVSQAIPSSSINDSGMPVLLRICSLPEVRSSQYRNSSSGPEIGRRRKVSLWKPFGTVVIVILALILMCGPYWSATCADTFCHCVEPWIYEDILAVIYNFHSLVNPFIYILTDRNYRFCVKKFLTKIKTYCSKGP